MDVFITDTYFHNNYSTQSETDYCKHPDENKSNEVVYNEFHLNTIEDCDSSEDSDRVTGWGRVSYRSLRKSQRRRGSV